MKRPALPPRRLIRGFTLVELIIVIVLIGALAGSVVMYLRPAVIGYLAVSKRANVSNQTDGAARLITTEIRTAVPNSLRILGGNQCAEFVPTSDGGRFRSAPDTVRDAANAQQSAPMDLSEAETAFDVLTPFTTTPLAGDFVVIGNQSADDIYSRRSIAMITGVSAAPVAGLGFARISVAPTQFPIGYEGGRFAIVPREKEAVTYRCVSPATNTATGTGTGTLMRYSRYGFNPNGACPPAGGRVSTIATKVSTCTFYYNPNEGATQQSGYLQVQLGITHNREAANLVFGAHVDNAP